MAQLQAPFNAQQFDPTQGGNFQQLPVGKHPVKIIASEIKATADNTGGMIVFELEVIDGPGIGSHGVMRLNLYSSKDKARAIAESQMSALCYATNVFMVTDTAMLHNIPFAVDVEEQGLTAEQEERKARGESVKPFTQVRKILDIQGNEPKAQGQQQGAQGAQGGGNWGQGQQTQQTAPAPAPAPATGGWGQGQQQAAQQAQAPAQAPAQQWNQNQGGGAAGGKPAWGKQ